MSGDVIIKGSRSWPSVVLVITAAGLVSMVLGPARAILPPVVLGAAIILQTAIVLWAVAVIVKPNKLTLGDEGFTIEPSLAKARTISWHDVEAVPARQPVRSAWLSWTPREGAVLPAFLARDTGAGRFPGSWTLSIEQIQMLMNDRLAKARR